MFHLSHFTYKYAGAYLDSKSMRLVFPPAESKGYSVYHFQLLVSDDFSSSIVPITVHRKGEADHFPPQWVLTPLVLDVRWGEELKLDLKSLITEPAFGMRFSSSIGPDWVTVSANGILTGKAPHPGEDHWRLSVSDLKNTTIGELVIQVAY